MLLSSIERRNAKDLYLYQNFEELLRPIFHDNGIYIADDVKFKSIIAALRFIFKYDNSFDFASNYEGMMMLEQDSRVNIKITNLEPNRRYVLKRGHFGKNVVQNGLITDGQVNQDIDFLQTKVKHPLGEDGYILLPDCYKMLFEITDASYVVSCDYINTSLINAVIYIKKLELKTLRRLIKMTELSSSESPKLIRINSDV
ncbi:MAG: hypothetical protein NC483_06970 [Ruminococcus sp.]|nr:hypothetical protein [Ruminococcus sp.]